MQYYAGAAGIHLGKTLRVKGVQVIVQGCAPNSQRPYPNLIDNLWAAKQEP